MPSFHGIQKDCSSIVSQLKGLLRERLDSNDSSTATVAETVDLLLELNEPAELLCQQFLEKYVFDLAPMLRMFLECDLFL